MPRACTVCNHPKRQAIDTALALVRASNRRIATQHTLSEAAVRRHGTSHLPASLARAADTREQLYAEDLLDQVEELRTQALDILATAEASGDLRTALGAIREARACIELLAEVEGRLDRRPHVTVLAAPEWIRIRTAMLEALMAYPEARASVAARLQVLDAAA